MLLRTICTFLVLILLTSSIISETPHQVSYQGSLTDGAGDPVADGLYELTFTIYDASGGGNSYWTSGPQMVGVTNGLFSYALGSAVPLPDSAFDSGSDRYLGIRVSSDPELSPRTQLLSAPYALHAQSAELGYVFQLVPQDIPGLCDVAGEGNVYYDSVLNEPCYCNGTDWVQMDGGGYCDCVDIDGDGYDVCDPGDPRDTDGLPADCDDANSTINPGVSEICNGIDDDCDGLIDDADPGLSGAPIWYADADGDGYGDPSTFMSACSQQPGWLADNTDCNDTDPLTNPGAVEICDDLDNDCDGTVDEDPIDGATWYADADGDGYGDPSRFVVLCLQPGGWVADNTDCDDTDPTINPGANEVCGDSKDNDCDGAVDEGC